MFTDNVTVIWIYNIYKKTMSNYIYKKIVMLHWAIILKIQQIGWVTVKPQCIGGEIIVSC